MKESDIKKVLKENPNAVFMAELPVEGDYVTRKKAPKRFLVTLHTHPKYGYWVATVCGTWAGLQEGWNYDQRLYNLRPIIKVYE